MTPDTFSTTLRRLLVAAVIAAPVLAHGWSPPPPPPPPPPAMGGGNPTQTPVGGAPTPEFNGPTGGAVTGTTTGGGNATGGTTGAPTTFTPGATAAAPHGAAGRTTGGMATPGKSKGMLSMWDEKVTIPWKSVFLPVVQREGYGSSVGTIADGVKLPQAQGGWARDDRPSIVIVFDSGNADHKRLLSALESDSRFKTAANFFNCFKVDATGTKAGDARLYVFGRDGAEMAQIAGQRKFNGAYDTLEIAYGKEMKVNLAEKAPQMDALLKSKAYVDHRAKQIEGGVVCPDCGHEREDIVEELGKLKVRGDACDNSIAALRMPATK